MDSYMNLISVISGIITGFGLNVAYSEYKRIRRSRAVHTIMHNNLSLFLTKMDAKRKRFPYTNDFDSGFNEDNTIKALYDLFKELLDVSELNKCFVLMLPPEMLVTSLDKHELDSIIELDNRLGDMRYYLYQAQHFEASSMSECSRNLELLFKTWDMIITTGNFIVK